MPRSTGTEPGVILGTTAYMSPEQVRGLPVDRHSDTWSFGCVLFECPGARRRRIHGQALVHAGRWDELEPVAAMRRRSSS